MLSQPVARWRHWWQHQDPLTQERFVMLGPLVSVLLFALALLATAVYLRGEEADREQETITRDINYAQQNLQLRVLDRLGQLNRVAQDVYRAGDTQELLFQGAILTSQFPELVGIGLFDNRGWLKSSYVSLQAPNSQLRDHEREVMKQATDAIAWVKSERRAVFGPVDVAQEQDAIEMGLSTVLVYLPVFDGIELRQIMAAEFNLSSLLRQSMPPDLASRYAMAIVNGEGAVLAGQLPKVRNSWMQSLPWVHPMPQYRVTLSPMGDNLFLFARGYRTSTDFVGQALQWIVAVLSLLTIWMLLTNWRHSRRRLKTQRALMDETHFRRAMEDSMLTGMRAMDMDGRITYVNPAFCRMTGWSEAELVGQYPPFSFWAEEDHDALMARLGNELKGMVNHSGFEVRLRRRNGVAFFARMYMSPLVSDNGEQTGWMASITDITEPKRTREELAAAHERFTTVLESLDAAVSVANLGGNALLFANARYRQWYGENVAGHHRMVMHAQVGLMQDDDQQDSVDDLAGMPTDVLLDATTEDTHVFDDNLSMWLEVRSRYLTWVDGSLAQIVIATDVTARHQAQAQADEQAEKAEAASRLITMGEMASSVAHELNQPLAAIANYCSGMISRLKRQQLEPADLLAALEKTSKQAQRAGQIIARIRSFVKRSEPSVTPTKVGDIVSEALELAHIELRRQNVRLNYYMAARLPEIMADPILIEQVLINLIKNGAESVSQAKRPHNQREVELHVRGEHVDGQAVVMFRVRDSGAGIPDEIRERIYDAFYSTKAEGMGIGLKLCRSIVESHHGRLQVENIYNNESITGCCFSFWIPVYTGSNASVPALQSANTASPTSETKP
jgi:PAS domain S-box-containing protein